MYENIVDYKYFNYLQNKKLVSIDVLADVNDKIHFTAKFDDVENGQNLTYSVSESMDQLSALISGGLLSLSFV